MIDRDHVAGFQSHQFRRLPKLPVTDQWWDPFEHAQQGEYFREFADDGIKRDEAWSVTKLELVSLLRHDEPCAYVSSELPRMDKLAEFSVRDLNGFERRALDELQGGKELVTQFAEERIQMMGSIRAARQCLKCHAVERGELLGAFSYVLEPTQPVRPRRDPNARAF